MPTLCVLNGSAAAGGLFHALGYDQILMKNTPKSYVWAPELNMGLPIPHTFQAQLQSLLPLMSVRRLVLGGKIMAEDSLRAGVAHDLYKTEEELEAKILEFAQSRARLAKHGHVLAKSRAMVNQHMLDMFDKAEYYGYMSPEGFQRLDGMLREAKL